MRIPKSLLAPSLLVLCGAGVLAAEQKLTYVDLINRLTDLEQLAVSPKPGESNAQWSSYERVSRYNEESGTYERWDANADGGGIIRKEGNDLVLAEMEGPGCIWRIWSATPKLGRVRIYLDGAAEPAVDLPFLGYFDGKNEPFTRPALVHTVARGWNNYTPIPYQKSCKIVAEPDWGLYYHFTYQTFPKGTQLPSFKRELTAAESAALDRANEALQNPNYRSVGNYPDVKQTSSRITVGAGKKVLISRIKGPRAITSLKARLPVTGTSADLEMLRELTLQIRWDGEQQPAVWSPFGDFFGTPTGRHYRSLPMGHAGDHCWYSQWYMPFEKAAEIEIVNDGQSARTITFEISHAALSHPVSDLMRFHAKWHRDAFLPPEPERQIDWTMLKTEGVGRFAGVMLHIWNPRGGWWGEGDEKFHVDGEAFPSTFGTGSEDYFGYAWCDPGLFENAYHNQTHNDGNNKGHIAVNRWHIADNIPFQKSFEAYIEKYYPNSKPTLYASTVYWYLAPGGEDPYEPLPLTDRVGYWGPVETLKVKGALEGESLRILSSTAGNPHEQDLSGFGDGWSNEAHLWWINAKPGSRLELALPVERNGRFKLGMQLTKAPDYGIVQLYLDGKKLGNPIDLFHNSVVPTGLLDFGAHDLTEGQHMLAIEILGANEKAVKSYMFGLDYVKLEPAS